MSAGTVCWRLRREPLPPHPGTPAWAAHLLPKAPTKATCSATAPAVTISRGPQESSGQRAGPKHCSLRPPPPSPVHCGEFSSPAHSTQRHNRGVRFSNENDSHVRLTTAGKAAQALGRLQCSGPVVCRLQASTGPANTSTAAPEHAHRAASRTVQPHAPCSLAHRAASRTSLGGAGSAHT